MLLTSIGNATWIAESAATPALSFISLLMILLVESSYEKNLSLIYGKSYKSSS